MKREQRSAQENSVIVWSMINKFMKNQKDRLTEKQHKINQRCANDTLSADNWLRQQGLDVKTFGTTPIRQLQAQHHAHQIITHHGDLLTQSQRLTLETFLQQMQTKRARDKIKAGSVNQVLNISSKVNRQLFRQHRQHMKA
jgi:type IV pilus biogenesis protein CpaD/CtpE